MVENTNQETQNQVTGVMKERELNFQEYTVMRQNQIEQKYQDKVKEIEKEDYYERDRKEDQTERDNSKERNPIISPEKEELSYINSHPQEESKNYQDESANINLNMYQGPLSEVNSSMNQKYQNESVYSIQKNEGNTGTLRDQIKAIKGVLSQPASDEHEGIRYDIQSITSDAPSRMNDSYSSIEEDPALIKHEQTKQAFEAYKGSYSGVEASGDYSLPLRESEFGNPTVSSKEFQRITTTKPTPRCEAMRVPENEGYDIRSQYMGGEGRISSAITEENDDGYTSSQYDNITQTSDQSNQQYPDYSQNKSYAVNEDISRSNYDKSMIKSYNSNFISPPQEYMKSPIDSSIGTSEISSTTSEGGENQDPNTAYGKYPPTDPNLSGYGFTHSKEVEEMSINPFYNPNPAFSSSYGFKKPE